MSNLIREFKAIFEDEQKRNNRELWRDFFISKEFLDEQYEDEYIKAMCKYLYEQKEVSTNKLPLGLMVELAIVYALEPEDDGYCEIEEYCICEEDEEDIYLKENGFINNEEDMKEYIRNGLDSFYIKQTAIIAKLWNEQDNYEENFDEFMSKASFIRRSSYEYYRNIRFYAIYKLWDYEGKLDSLKKYKYDLSMGHYDFLADDDTVNSMDIKDIRYEDSLTHSCLLELFDYLLQKYQFSIEPCAYMYSYFELEDIEETEYAPMYKDLKSHILELYPNIDEYCKSNISSEDYAPNLSEMLKQIQAKYKNLGWGKNMENLRTPCYAKDVVDWCEEEAEEIYKIVDSELFQKHKYSKHVIKKLIISKFTITQAKIFFSIYHRPEAFEEAGEAALRLLHMLIACIRINEKQKEYLMSEEYDYDLSTDSYDFMEYFLSVAFDGRHMQVGNEPPIPARYVYDGKLGMSVYMTWTYKPSMEWRLRFTNYNKETGEFGKPRTYDMELIDGTKVTLEFHYHYIRYYINDKEVYAPELSVSTLYDNAKDLKTFLLLLPLIKISSMNAGNIEEYLKAALADCMPLPVSGYIIAAILTDNEVKSKDEERIKSRRYIENINKCYRLDTYIDNTRKLYSYNETYECFEDMGKDMLGKHYRWECLGELDDEGWDMETFKESDITLPYEVETKVHDLSDCKPKKKLEALLDIFRENHKESDELPHFLSDNKVVLVFGDKNRIHLRQHFETSIILDNKMEQDAYSKNRYLSLYMDKIRDYAREKLEWFVLVKLENYYDVFPIAKGVSGKYYAFVSSGDNKKYKSDSFEKVLAKAIGFEDLTQVIEYEVCDRSDWDNNNNKIVKNIKKLLKKYKTCR